MRSFFGIMRAASLRCRRQIGNRKNVDGLKGGISPPEVTLHRMPAQFARLERAVLWTINSWEGVQLFCALRSRTQETLLRRAGNAKSPAGPTFDCRPPSKSMARLLARKTV